MGSDTTSSVLNVKQSTVYTYSPTSQCVEGVSTAEYDNSDLVGWPTLNGDSAGLSIQEWSWELEKPDLKSQITNVQGRLTNYGCPR